VNVEEISDRSDRFTPEAIHFQKYVIVGKPLHHCVVFKCGLLKFRYRFITEDAATDGDFVAIDRAFRCGVYKEEFFEFRFLHWHGIVGWVDKVVVIKRVDCYVGIMTNPLRQ